MGPASESSQQWKVADLFIPGSVDWDVGKIQCVLPRFKDIILALKPNRIDGSDKKVWLPAKDGLYTTKSGYQVARQSQPGAGFLFPELVINWKKEVWGLQISPKLQLFMWKALKGALPAGAQLASRNISIEPSCIRCRNLESICHILFTCLFAQRVWNQAALEKVESMPAFVEVLDGFLWL